MRVVAYQTPAAGCWTPNCIAPNVSAYAKSRGLGVVLHPISPLHAGSGRLARAMAQTEAEEAHRWLQILEARAAWRRPGPVQAAANLEGATAATSARSWRRWRRERGTVVPWPARKGGNEAHLGDSGSMAGGSPGSGQRRCPGRPVPRSEGAAGPGGGADRSWWWAGGSSVEVWWVGGADEAR